MPSNSILKTAIFSCFVLVPAQAVANSCFDSLPLETPPAEALYSVTSAELIPVAVNDTQCLPTTGDECISVPRERVRLTYRAVLDLSPFGPAFATEVHTQLDEQGLLFGGAGEDNGFLRGTSIQLASNKVLRASAAYRTEDWGWTWGTCHRGGLKWSRCKWKNKNSQIDVSLWSDFTITFKNNDREMTLDPRWDHRSDISGGTFRLLKDTFNGLSDVMNFFTGENLRMGDAFETVIDFAISLTFDPPNIADRIPVIDLEEEIGTWVDDWDEIKNEIPVGQKSQLEAFEANTPFQRDNTVFESAQKLKVEATANDNGLLEKSFFCGVLRPLLDKSPSTEEDTIFVSRRTLVHPPNSTSSTHTISPGETMWSIAEDAYGNGSFYHSILSYNEISNAELRIGLAGREITLPSVDQILNHGIVVSRGQTLQSIADSHLGSPPAMARVICCEPGVH